MKTDAVFPGFGLRNLPAPPPPSGRKGQRNTRREQMLMFGKEATQKRQGQPPALFRKNAKKTLQIVLTSLLGGYIMKMPRKL